MADAKRGVALQAALAPAAEGVTYPYRLALNEDNTAGATVTADGRLVATQRGEVRVTVLADLAGATYSRTSTVTVR